MPVLVLGATGFIGPQVIRRLSARGEEVVAIHRGDTPAAPSPGVTVRRADRRDAGAIAAIVRDCRASAVVDMIAYTEASTRPLLQALAGATDRYVLVSSADVYRNYGGLLWLEDAAPVAHLAEDAPLRQSRYPRRRKEPGAAPSSRAFQDEYDKIPIEAAALAQPGLAATVLRLPMVFGPTDHQRRFAWIIWRLRDGRDVVPMQRRVAAWRSTFGYVDDVGEAIALAALHPAAAGHVYNVGRADAPTQAEWAGKFAAAMGKPIRIAPCEEGGALASLAELDVAFDLATDTQRIRQELGFAELLAEEEALRRTIAEELARGRPEGLEAEYLAEDALPSEATS